MGTGIDPIIQIGKAGYAESLIRQLDEALEARELVKVRVLQNSAVEPRMIASELAEAARAELVQIIGRNLLFFRRSEKKPTIFLPK